MNTHASPMVLPAVWKLLRLRSTRESQPFFQFELYDLDADPEELIDRWPTEPVVGEALRQLLVRRGHIDEATRQRATAPVELTPKARENLRALGYVE